MVVGIKGESRDSGTSSPGRYTLLYFVRNISEDMHNCILGCVSICYDSFGSWASYFFKKIKINKTPKLHSESK